MVSHVETVDKHRYNVHISPYHRRKGQKAQGRRSSQRFVILSSKSNLLRNQHQQHQSQPHTAQKQIHSISIHHQCHQSYRQGISIFCQLRSLTTVSISSSTISTQQCQSSVGNISTLWPSNIGVVHPKYIV